MVIKEPFSKFTSIVHLETRLNSILAILSFWNAFDILHDVQIQNEHCVAKQNRHTGISFHAYLFSFLDNKIDKDVLNILEY